MTSVVVSDKPLRARYARQVQLLEIGLAGQQRLLATQVIVSPAGHPVAVAACEAYLQRAGVCVTADGDMHPLRVGAIEDLSLMNRVGDRAPTLATAGAIAAAGIDTPLSHAAAFVMGAYAAVECIKSGLGVGKPALLAIECLGPSEVAE